VRMCVQMCVCGCPHGRGVGRVAITRQISVGAFWRGIRGFYRVLESSIDAGTFLCGGANASQMCIVVLLTRLGRSVERRHVTITKLVSQLSQFIAGQAPVGLTAAQLRPDAQHSRKSMSSRHSESRRMHLFDRYAHIYENPTPKTDAAHGHRPYAPRTNAPMIP